jgi:nicotinamide-nucleotide amidase
MPKGAIILTNPKGTAPGFYLKHDQVHLFCMPGVPREMRPMFTDHVAPRMAKLDGIAPPILHRIRTIGVPESTLQRTLGPMDLSPAELGFRSHMPEVIVKLVFPANTPQALRTEKINAVTQAIGRGVYTVDGGDLAEVVSERLVARGETLALAESCTSGRIASWVTQVPGASRYFLEGAIVYANAAKVRTCGVSTEDLNDHGAVSEPVARQLASGMRARAGSDWAIGVTGIAGPGGGSADKPVGTVHIAIAGPSGVTHKRLRIPGDRAQITGRAAGMALGLLLEQL